MYHIFVNFNVIIMVLASRKFSLHLPKQEEKEILYKIEKIVFFNLNYWTKCRIISFML